MAKIGEGHAAAMLRLGLAEIRNAMNPSRESVADRDMGLYGNATPGQVDQQRSGPEQESLADVRVAAREMAARQEAERGKDGPEMEQSREM